MDTPETELPRRTNWGRLAVGCLVAVGIALAAGSPAMADNWNNGHGKHWKKKHHKHHNDYYSYGYYHQPQVVYVHPRPIYVQPAPVYVAPPPPVYYYQPYHRPSLNIVFPIDID